MYINLYKKNLDNSDEIKQQITTTGEEQYKTAEETVKIKQTELQQQERRW